MQRIGRYEVTDHLGAGSFATVHHAHDLRLDDEVAVKVLAENHTLNPDMLSASSARAGLCGVRAARTWRRSTTSANCPTTSRTWCSSWLIAAPWAIAWRHCAPRGGLPIEAMCWWSRGR